MFPYVFFGGLVVPFVAGVLYWRHRHPEPVPLETMVESDRIRVFVPDVGDDVRVVASIFAALYVDEHGTAIQWGCTEDADGEARKLAMQVATKCTCPKGES